MAGDWSAPVVCVTTGAAAVRIWWTAWGVGAGTDGATGLAPATGDGGVPTVGAGAGSGAGAGAVLTTTGALDIAAASAPAAAEPTRAGAWAGAGAGVCEYVLETTGMRWVRTRWRTTTRRVTRPAVREVLGEPAMLRAGDAAVALRGAVPAACCPGSATCGNRGTGIASTGIEIVAAGASSCARIAPTRMVT
jgi:hypothetical protein